MISTCKCYITLHLSMHCLPDLIMILIKTWLPLKSSSALPASCPVIELFKALRVCKFSVSTRSFPYDVRFLLLYYTFSGQNAGGNIIGNGMTKQQDSLLSMLYLENVKKYDQNFPQVFCFQVVWDSYESQKLAATYSLSQAFKARGTYIPSF